MAVHNEGHRRFVREQPAFKDAVFNVFMGKQILTSEPKKPEQILVVIHYYTVTDLANSCVKYK